MSDVTFKKKNKPALCTLDPIMSLVSKEKFHEIQNIVKQKLRDAGLEYDLSCPKRFTCNGKCSGRPVYHQVDELKPYIDKVKHLIAKDGMIYLQGCQTCPIVKTCKSTCNQISDFMNRSNNKEDLTVKMEPVQISTDNAMSNWVSDDIESNPSVLSELIERYGSIQAIVEQLPWGAVSDKRQRLIRMYVFEGKDFRACANELGYSNGNVSRNEFYRSLTVLSKYATVRYFIEQHRDDISDLEYELLQLRYYEFLPLEEIGIKLNMPTGTVRSKIFRFLKKANTKYSRFVVRGKTVPSNIF
jgi:Sigma-70, region 4